MNWRVGLGITFAAITISAWLVGLNSYSLGETMFLLLLLWAAMLAIGLFLVTLVLLSVGVRLGSRFVKVTVLRILKLSGMAFSRTETVRDTFHARPH